MFVPKNRMHIVVAAIDEALKEQLRIRLPVIQLPTQLAS